MAIRPATPGTVVVFIAAVLLILVSVSAPILKQIYFLKATVGGENIYLGTWGYCSDSKCTSASLGYSLDLEQLFDFNGVAGIDLTESIPTTLVKWLTYVLVLHPVAAGFALLATILGLLAHIRGFQGTCFTTVFASFGATTALIAFAFDLGLFIVAKKRIESSAVGGRAELGAALWMTLVAAVLLMVSGCFFGCGKRIVRDRRSGREASEKTKPQPDAAWGSSMRDAAFENKTLDGKNYHSQHGKDTSLPVFADRYGEAIPLNSMSRDRGTDEDEEWDDYNPQQPRYPGGYVPGGGPPRGGEGAGSLVSGVGEGYGRRTDGPAGGVPVSLAPSSIYSAGGAGVGAGGAAAVGGAGAYLAADARANRGMPGQQQQQLPQRSASGSHVEPFVGMSSAVPGASRSPPPTSPTGYSSQPQHDFDPMPQPQHYHDPYVQQQQGYGAHPQHDAYDHSGPSSSSALPVPFANPPHLGANQYPSEKSLPNSHYSTTNNASSFYATPDASASSMPQQQFHVQNPSPPPGVVGVGGNDHPGPAPSYVTHQPYGAQSDYGHGQQGQGYEQQGQYGEQQQQQYGYGGGQQRY